MGTSLLTFEVTLKFSEIISKFFIMKRVTIIAMMFAVFSLSAQQPAETSPNIAVPLSAAESARLQQDLQNKLIQREARAKTAGPDYLSQRMAHYEIAALQFGNLIRPVYTPVAPDSTYIQDFKGDDNINIHGFGQVLDPTSVGYSVIGQPHFSKNDAYEVDTIYVGVRYRTSSPTSGYTGDTLRVTAYFGYKTDNSVWNVGIGYNPNTFPNQPYRVNVATPRYMGNSAIGTPGNITSANKIVFKYAFKDMDTTVNFIKIVPSSPLQIGAGQKFGVFCDFMPSQSYDPSTQKYYVSGGKSDVNNLSWLYLTAQNSADNTPYFLETLQIGAPSDGLSNLLYSKTRYNSWTGNDSFRNGYVAPSTLSGNMIDFWVTGITTVGLDEEENKELAIYPNPGNGVVNIRPANPGKHRLQVVSLTGQLLYQEDVATNGNEVLERDFSNLTKGIYVIQLLDGEQQSSARLIVQ